MCETLTAETGKRELASHVAEYLESVPIADVAAATRLVLGVPVARRAKLNFGASQLWAAVIQAAPAEHKAYREVTKDAVDVGDAVFGVMETFGNMTPRHLSIGEVSSSLEQIASIEGEGALVRKQELVTELFQAMTALEAKWLAKIIVGEMRHGVSEGLMVDAAAIMAGTERRRVETAFMFAGAIDEVVEGIRRRGAAYLDDIRPITSRPVKPMLAQPSGTVEEALDLIGEALVLEYKLDGARVQVHKEADRISLFSRALRDMTANLPDIVEICKAAITAHSAILDGEVIATDDDGRPLPFQQLSKRITAEALTLGFAEPVATKLYLFDVLLLDGRPVHSEPLAERRRLLMSAIGEQLAVPSLERPSKADAEAFYARALDEGHEGLMAKHLESPYRPGSRGKHWLKIKKKITLDLVIIAAEYGYGRRHGWLSNYLLATKDEASGRLVPVGKTFKGLTDAEFEAMTERLMSLKTGEVRGGITVRPEVMVEVSFGDIQKSRKYESGFALRFARIERIRPDLGLEDVDTLERLRAIHQPTS